MPIPARSVLLVRFARVRARLSPNPRRETKFPRGLAFPNPQFGNEGKIRVLLEGDTREQPALHAASKQRCGFEAIAAAISKEFEETWETLRDRRGHPARSFAIVLWRRHTALKLKQIGEYCGGMDYAAVSQANHRMENTLRENRDFAAVMKRIVKRITNVED